MAKPGVFDGFYLIFGFLALNDHGWWRWDALPRGRVIGNRGQQGDWLDRVNPDIGRPQDPDGGRYDPPQHQTLPEIPSESEPGNGKAQA